MASEREAPEPGAYKENPECFKIHGDYVHGVDCAPVSETNRWWQAFCAHAAAPDFIQGDSFPIDAVDCADFADKSIAEAKKRGRL
jgi:hypothetical protein